ncbi:MAG: TolC family protein [Flavobacteriales bacterium]|nr:TolC family protein [Flavobacteriales bacterium]
MKTKQLSKYFLLVLFPAILWGCIPGLRFIKTENRTLPQNFGEHTDSSNIANKNWREVFQDSNLISLIDTALKNNQELNIILQEIEISKNEIMAKKGEYLPFVKLGLGNGLEKSGKFTRNGAVEEQLDIKDGKKFPEPLQDHFFGASASWELDIWNKLRNARKSSVASYLASIEGKNFMITNLVAEISEAYYELMALDNVLDIVVKNIEIQSSALNVVKQQKDAAKVSQLAVNRFQAQLLNTQNLQYEVKQKIIETENRINFLTGQFPQTIKRNWRIYLNLDLNTYQTGIPSDLLMNRPDINQAENELNASKIDVKVARAGFLPSMAIRAGMGFQAFNPVFLLNPESLMYNFAGDLVSPLINRKAIKTEYFNANSKQIQAVYNYERTILNAYLDVLNQMSKIENYTKSFETKKNEVDLLIQSVTIANSLFNAARADYAEVLLTQREALESKMDLVEIKMKQINAEINIYRALGGGWR